MSNELQTNLDAILLDKNTNLKPENLKAGVSCLGVDGTMKEGIDADLIYATGNNLLNANISIPELNGYFTTRPSCLISDDKKIIVLSSESKLKVYKLVDNQYIELYTDTTQRPKCRIVGPYNNIYYVFDFYRDTYLKIDLSNDSVTLVTISNTYSSKRYTYCSEYHSAYNFDGRYYYRFDLSTEQFSRSIFLSSSYNISSQYNAPFFNNGNILWFSDGYSNIYDRLCKINSDSTISTYKVIKDINIQAVNNLGNKILLGGCFYDLDTNLNITNKSESVLDDVPAIMLSDNTTLLLPNTTSLGYFFNSIDVYKINWDDNAVTYIKTISFSTDMVYTGTGLPSLSIFDTGFIEDTSVLLTNTLSQWAIDITDSVSYITYDNTAYYPGITKATDKDVLSGKSVMGIDGDILQGSMPNNGDVTIAPTTSEQVKEKGYYNSLKVSAVTSNIDENIKAENIKSGVEILGVTGTLEGGIDTSDATATVKDILAGKTAYVDGEKLEGTMANNGDLIITPNTDEQEHSAGYYNSVQVRPVTSSVDTNIKAENIKSGISILGVSGSVIELNGHELEVTPSTEQKVIEPEENYNAITRVTVKAVTSAIDSNITPENIKSGVSILGVTGTYNGEVLLSNQVPTSSPDKLTYAVVVNDGGNYLGTYKYDPSSGSGGTWEKLVETV